MLETLPPFSPDQLQADVDRYIKELFKLFGKFHLTNLLYIPVDHMAIKTPDKDSYLVFLESTRPFRQKVRITQMKGEGREIATVFLKEPIDCGVLGETKLLEVMQPRPSKEGTGYIGLEHLEGLPENLASIPILFQRNRAILGAYPQKNSSHQTIVIPFSQKTQNCQEFKFTNRSLRDITNEQLKTGQTIEMA